MNNLKKIGLTALAGSLIAGSVNAADLSVSGGVSINLTGLDSGETSGNGFTQSDSINFSASGDVNDMTVTFSYEIENGAEDDNSISLDMGDAGTLTYSGHGQSSALSAVDDVMPTAKEEPWDVVTGADAGIINGNAQNNSFKYTYSHDSGATFTAYYVNADSTGTAVSYSDLAIDYTGVENLRIGYAAGTTEATAGTEIEEDTMYAVYTMGGLSLGVQVSEADSSAAGADTESTGYGISYQVSDDLAISYGGHEIEYATGDDQEASAVGISYTMGSMGISATMNKVDNVANASATDRTSYEAGIVFNF